MSHVPLDLARPLSAKLVALPRPNKIALMLAADLAALPLCFLLALLLRLDDAAALARCGLASYVLLAALSVAACAMTSLYSAAVRHVDARLLLDAGFGLGLAALCL